MKGIFGLRVLSLGPKAQVLPMPFSLCTALAHMEHQPCPGNPGPDEELGHQCGSALGGVGSTSIALLR